VSTTGPSSPLVRPISESTPLEEHFPFMVSADFFAQKLARAAQTFLWRPKPILQNFGGNRTT
jgi:hypothetical protein